MGGVLDGNEYAYRGCDEILSNSHAGVENAGLVHDGGGGGKARREVVLVMAGLMVVVD